LRARSIGILAFFAIIVASVAANAQQNEGTGVWQGRYVCAQGETYFRLTILPEGDDADRAFFYFYPPPGTNPGETGCFSLSMSEAAGQNRLTLREKRWIDWPFGYVMVSLDGAISEDGRTYSGTVNGPGCREFTVERMPITPDRAEACRPLTQ
jgi:hypothetical protein